jgi:hypothetical protein
MKTSAFIISLFFIFLSATVSGSTERKSLSATLDGKIPVPALNLQKADTTLKIIYTCPMHAEVVQDKPGKCPKCGMNLVKKEIAKETYVCPMHSDVKQDKPGKCPKCGMNLVKQEKAKK